MHSLVELKERLKEDRPALWQELPDIALYMDQIVSYMPRQLIGVDENMRLTPAMVNNYIKDGLLPRANGKRYGKEHVAYLTAICILKQLLPVREMAPLLEKAVENREVESFYADLTAQLDRELSKTAEKVDAEMDDIQLCATALELAVSAYCQQLLCKQLIRMLADTDGKKKRKKEKT